MTKPFTQAVKDLVGAPLRMALLSDELSRRLGLTSLEDERLAAVRPWIKGRLLDVGAGNNRLVREYGDGVGVDIHDFGGGAVLLSDTSQLPYPAGSFDTVTFVASLNHILDRDAVLREANRVLRDDGRLLVTMIDPVISSIGHRIWWYSEDKHRGGMRHGEVYGFWPRAMRDLLRHAGFTLLTELTFLYGLNHLYIAQKPRDQRGL